MTTTYVAHIDSHEELLSANLPAVLYLIVIGNIDGQTSTVLAVLEQDVIRLAKECAASPVRIFRVERAEMTYLEVQREIVRERLVPKGEAVNH